MPFRRRVQPALTSSTATDPARSSRSGLGKLKEIFPKLVKYYASIASSWRSIQIGHREHYSVERVLAFRDYCERTSRARVFAVCALTPAPAAVVMLLIECIPLKSPEEGWKENWEMWVRVFVAAIFVGGGIVFLTRATIAEAKISISRAIGITIVSALLYTGLSCLLAATWKYPIPFGMVLLVCPFVWIIMNLILLSIDRNELKTNKNLQKQLVGHIIGTSAQSLLVVAYPTFNAVFLQLSGVQQAVFMFVLPVIKFTTKQTIAKVGTHLQDYIGVVTVFSVDVFNVLYVAICMQTARSSLTTVLVMSTDVLHIVLALRSIYHHTNRIRQQSVDNVNYLDKVLSSLDKFKPKTKPYTGSIRLLMPYKLPLSDVSNDFLLALTRKWNSPPSSEESSARQATLATELGPSTQLILRPPQQCIRLTGNHNGSVGKESCRQMLPVSPEAGVSPHESIHAQSDRHFNVTVFSDSQRSTRRSVSVNPSRGKIERSIQESLQVLFHCEYVLLSEYIECILPFVYAGYLAGLYRLPTAAYYPYTRSLTPAKLTSTLIQLVIYGSLEFLSFMGLHVLLKKRLGYSPVYQLAFVLETHVVMLQSLLFVWIVFIVQLTLVHAGVDFDAPFQ
ncbi:hypothetical protein PHYPSEUDO_005187 [Phytophthora pseudosyringae]|uniref:Transmembrane protein n=1 Tax=Phytophthora pseudosyringae TaxID=221518 RepID=A0A8T1VM12_9STRA|nr:hypothetical protein PHYPSEUDO_005187 [Phytophthora pseudosyringae]